MNLPQGRRRRRPCGNIFCMRLPQTPPVCVYIHGNICKKGADRHEEDHSPGAAVRGAGHAAVRRDGGGHDLCRRREPLLAQHPELRLGAQPAGDIEERRRLSGLGGAPLRGLRAGRGGLFRHRGLGAGRHGGHPRAGRLPAPTDGAGRLGGHGLRRPDPRGRHRGRGYRAAAPRPGLPGLPGKRPGGADLHDGGVHTGLHAGRAADEPAAHRRGLVPDRAAERPL